VDRFAIQSPLVIEPISSSLSIECPTYEGTGLYLRCKIKYPLGSHVTAIFSYGDGTAASENITYGK